MRNVLERSPSTLSPGSKNSFPETRPNRSSGGGIIKFMDDLFADPVKARLTLSMGVLLLGTWIFAALVPPMIGGVFPRPEAWIWWLTGSLFAYFGYTGVRAQRRGWKSRFILRIVVPLSLFAISSLLTILGVWLGK